MWNGNIQSTILYEDKYILVCHKPAGLAVQNARIGVPDMESALKNYLAGQNPGNPPYLGIVHRLDQPVEGVIAFAKTPEAAAGLSRQMTSGQWGKEYLAVTDRRIEKASGTLTDFLKKDARTNTSGVVSADTKGAKKARLSYEIKDEINDGRTETGKRILVTIHLETGRHHQIRVQMANAGMPLLGDRKYNSRDMSGLSLGLCAHRLTFVHPKTGKKQEFCIVPRGNAFEGFTA